MIDYNQYLILSDKVRGFAGDYSAYQDFKEAFKTCENIYSKKVSSFEYGGMFFELPVTFSELEKAVDSVNDGIFNSSAIIIKRVATQIGIRRI